MNCFSATKVSEDELDGTSDILGVSGVIVQDLKQKRMNSYEFNWKSMLDVSYLGQALFS